VIASGRFPVQACIFGYTVGDILLKGQSAYSNGYVAWGDDPWRWVAAGFAVRLAVAQVVELVAGQVMWRHLQVLLPQTCPRTRTPADLQEPPQHGVVFRILQASERKRPQRPADMGPRAGCTPGLEGLGRPCYVTIEALVSAGVDILTPHTSTTGAERSARSVRTAGVGGETSGRSCTYSRD
jgi:hypothetical protein